MAPLSIQPIPKECGVGEKIAPIYYRSIFRTFQDNGKKAELDREPENRESSLEAEDRDKKIISSEEEAKARIAEKRREMKVMIKKKFWVSDPHSALILCRSGSSILSNCGSGSRSLLQISI
jgi:hypothetical protein